MKSLSKFTHNAFATNILKLAGGTSLAHLVTIGVSPILTRLFPAEWFGELQTFQSSVIIGAIILTGTYELAIVRPRYHFHAVALLKLSLLLATGVAIVTVIPMVALSEPIARSLNIEEYLIWLFPPVLLIQTYLNSFNYYYLREDRYSLLSANKFSQSSAIALTQVTAGYIRLPLNGLVLGVILGRVVALSIYVSSAGKRLWTILFRIPVRRLKVLAKEYSAHPTYISPSTLMSSGGIEIPVLLIGSLFGQAELGFYALAYRVLSSPSAFLGTSVGQVFYRDIAQKVNDRKPILSTVTKTWMWLFLIVIIPMIVLFLYPEELFAFVFGKEWSTAGTVAKVLIPLLTIDFISAPTGKTLILLDKQKPLTIFSFLISLSRITGILAGVILDDFFMGLSLLVIAHSLILVMYNIFLFLSASRFDKTIAVRPGNSL